MEKESQPGTLFRNLKPTATLVVVALLVFIWAGSTIIRPAQPVKPTSAFSGERAHEHVLHQVSLGPRIPGSEGHARTRQWISEELQAAGWLVETQRTTRLGHPVENIIARREAPESPWVILGAHYDTRILADKDPDLTRRSDPVPGANDGASGVAVLLEIARVLPSQLDRRVWLVFFDAEDNGDIQGWDWILGSRAFVESLDADPDAVVILDMVGDADLNIFLERNSDPVLSEQIWDTAAALGYAENFIPRYKYSILDDHIPFLQAGIRAADLIDFDYPYHHTTEDDIDKVSPQSLAVVGQTVVSWLLSDGVDLIAQQQQDE